MKIGIAMIPNSEMIEAIIDLQKQVMCICPFSSKLGTERNLPHVTLLQGRFKDFVDWSSLLNDLRDSCIQQNYSLDLKLIGLKHQSPNWYFLMLNQNSAFTEAHQFVFQRLKTLMVLSEADQQKDMSGYTALEKLNYFNYGYRFIGHAFHPHITLGRTGAELPIAQQTNLVDRVESLLPCIGAIDSLTLYEQGENGSHAKTLFSLKL